MATDWRGLFDFLNVPWVDKGANHSRGNVNVRCPWCIDDPSHHLGISEETGMYWCFRDNTHSGGNPTWVLEAILKQIRTPSKVSIRAQAVLLLEDYGMDLPAAIPFDEKKLIPWTSMDFAEESNAMMNYLWERGYNDPEKLSKRFDLRYAKKGTWARRLLFPLINGDKEVISWTGRTIDDRQPRYLAREVPNLSSLFSGRLDTETLLLVEGPFDALRINSVSHDLSKVAAAGISGTYLSPGRIAELYKRNYKAIGVLMDPEADTKIYKRMMAAMANKFNEAPFGINETIIRRITLPSGIKDPDTLNEQDAKVWLHGEVEKTLASDNSTPLRMARSL